MPDISMCKGTNCTIKETCYRYKAIPSDWQSYFTESPIKDNKTCDYYLELFDITKLKKENLTSENHVEGGNNE